MEYLDCIHTGKVIRKTLFSLITNVNRHFPANPNALLSVSSKPRGPTRTVMTYEISKSVGIVSAPTSNGLSSSLFQTFSLPYLALHFPRRPLSSTTCVGHGAENSGSQINHTQITTPT